MMVVVGYWIGVCFLDKVLLVFGYLITCVCLFNGYLICLLLAVWWLLVSDFGLV